MRGYLKAVFLIFLFAAFVLEGLGINRGREVAYMLILAMPFFLFIPYFIFKEKRDIVLPQRLTFLFLIFIILSAVSSVFGVNLQNSFENLVLYVSLFLVFIFVFNNKDILKSFMVPSVLILGFTFSIFSMFASLFIKENSLFSIPIDFSSQGYQFIYSAFGSHNHLGDFLLLPLTIIAFKFFSLKSKFRFFLLFLVFIPYFIFSYSRSAYLDLMLILIMLSVYMFKEYRKKITPQFVAFSVFMLVVLAVFLFVVPTDTKKPTVLNSFNATLRQKYNLDGGKLFLAYRNIYAAEGLFSISKSPLFGIGPGNFIYASTKYTNVPGNTSVTSHNLFFDIFVENGILAGLTFLALALTILSSIKIQLGMVKSNKLNNNNVLFIFLFLAMLLNFQTDYTYLIHSFLLLFFVLLGLFYNEQSTKSLKTLTLFSSLLLLFIFNPESLRKIRVFIQDSKTRNTTEASLDNLKAGDNVTISFNSDLQLDSSSADLGGTITIQKMRSKNRNYQKTFSRSKKN